MEYSARTLGKIVRDARNKMGVTQGQAAEMAGLDTRTIMNIENGKGNPKIKSLFPLFQALKIDSHEVFSPELLQESAAFRQFRLLLGSCTEAEADALLPVMKAVLSAMRAMNPTRIQ